MKIKVTHISPTDIKGGADLSGYRLHKEMLKNPEIDSVLFVNKKFTDDNEVVEFSNPILKQIERVLNKIGYLTGLQYLFSVNWIPLLFDKRFRETDIFIIKNIHGGYLPIWFPNFLLRFAPVVWRMADMWPFTGHCVYCKNDHDWKIDPKKGCGKSDYPAVLIETSSLLLKLKKFFYSQSNIHIVVPSKWMEDNVKGSILKECDVSYIPTGVDEKIFRPTEKYLKPSIIFVSVNLSDKRKGIEILPTILDKLNGFLKSKGIFIDFYWVGEKDSVIPEFSNINYIFLGFLKSDDLTKYYARSHVFILPTRSDNLPNTIIEAAACGTPAVSFDVGGCKDAIIHMKTGYLARFGNADDFVNGIIKILFEIDKNVFFENSRKLFLEKFTMKKQVSEYISLFKKILKTYG